MKTDAMTIRRKLKKYFFLHFEWIFLLTGLVILAFIDPLSQAESICPAKRFELGVCPGCGLGKSISYVFKGEFMNSISAHPAGIFAILVIPARIIKIFHRNHKIINEQDNEKNI